MDTNSTPNQAISLGNISLETMENVISEDVVLGSLTGKGLEVKAIQVCLLRETMRMVI